MTQETALIVGVGPGLGAALARRFARCGMKVAMVARSPDKLASLAAELAGTARAYACDAADEHAVTKLFADVAQDFSAHVAHVIIDGQIASDRPGRSVAERGEDAVLDPDAIAETYYQLHLQPPSAWTLELDLRPYVEKF